MEVVDPSHAQLQRRLEHAEELVEFWRHPEDGTHIGNEGLLQVLRAMHIDLRDRIGELSEEVKTLSADQAHLDAEVAAENAGLDAANSTIADLSTHLGNLIAEVASLKSQIAGGVSPQSLDFTGADAAGAKAQAALAALQEVDATAAGADALPSTPPAAAPVDAPPAPPADAPPAAPADSTPPADATPPADSAPASA